jgi:enamine deaminase RidA (YjgF/YER057c/UK114 family)
VAIGNMLFVSGTTALGPGGKTVGVGDAYAQTVEALRRIAKALEEAGFGLKDVVHTCIYVTDIGQWDRVAQGHREFFGDVRPACTMVEVRRLMEPELLVEIEATALKEG